MPVNKKLAKKLIEQYGYLRGKAIYYAMEGENSDTFKKGLETAAKKKETLKKFPKQK